jgi:hypothetical protein
MTTPREPTDWPGLAYRVAKDFGVSTVLLVLVLWRVSVWLEHAQAATDVHRAAAVEQLAKLAAAVERLDRHQRATADAITTTWPRVRIPSEVP